MLSTIVFKLFMVFPRFKKFCWRTFYNRFAKKAKTDELKFMNYGYHDDKLSIELKPEDEMYRYSIQLYHHVATQVDIKGKKVLEVGSGRGGGASYIASYLQASEVIGVDISSEAVTLCNQVYQLDNLAFQTADSENLPFNDNSFDVVVNVESSHCYGSMDVFIAEVSRVLKPGGVFLFCDLRPEERVQKTLDIIAKSGLTLREQKNITSNIITSTELMSENRKSKIAEMSLSKPMQKKFESFSCVKGSEMHNRFVTGVFQYISAYYVKE